MSRKIFVFFKKIFEEEKSDRCRFGTSVTLLCLKVFLVENYAVFRKFFLKLFNVDFGEIICH